MEKLSTFELRGWGRDRNGVSWDRGFDDASNASRNIPVWARWSGLMRGASRSTGAIPWTRPRDSSACTKILSAPGSSPASKVSIIDGRS